MTNSFYIMDRTELDKAKREWVRVSTLVEQETFERARDARAVKAPPGRTVAQIEAFLADRGERQAALEQATAALMKARQEAADQFDHFVATRPDLQFPRLHTDVDFACSGIF